MQITHKYQNWSVSHVSFLLMAILFSAAMTVAVFPQQPGDLDPTFGNAGKVVTTGIGWRATASSVAIQPDGKIVTAGNIGYAGFFDFAVARYNPDGSPDTTFGTAGMVVTPVEGLSSWANSVAVQADGKIVAAGAVSADGWVDWIMLARYNPDGSLDTTFGTDGIVQTWIEGGDTASSVAIQPDGKIVIGVQTYRFTLVRYNTNGSLDAGFGDNGIVTTQVGSYGPVTVAIQPDEKIVAVGSGSVGTPSNEDFILARYNSNGSLDTGFGSGGIVTTPIGSSYDRAKSVAIQSDGKIVAAGQIWNGSNWDFGLARFNSNGSLDTTFGTGGTVVTPFEGVWSGANSVVIQPDGNIVAAGQSDNGSNYDFTLARYNTNGSLDTTFGGGDGIATVDFENSNDFAFGMALDSQGRAVVVGRTENGANTLFALARVLLGPGAVVPDRAPFDFDGDGKTDAGIFRPGLGEWWLLRSMAGPIALQFGVGTDVIAPGDYTGDGKADVAFFRPSTGEWFILRSEDFSYFSFPFGTAGDVPATGDYDGDGKSDVAVFRPSTGEWYVLRSSDGGVTILQWGLPGDVPVTADYDGDGKDDIAIFRPSVGEWWLLRSTDGAIALRFGEAGDRALPGDYTGDGRADTAFWRPSTGEWFILRSEDFSYFSFPFGTTGDNPVPGDYDGDGLIDPAVFRPASGTWFVLRSTAGTQIFNWGLDGDRPVPGAFVR